MKPIGILGLQGDYEAHRRALARAGAEATIVRWPHELPGCSGLVLPGGESTALLKLMAPSGFLDALREYGESGGAIFGTCAGAILLARQVEGPAQPSLGLMDIDIRRNAYGRQTDSFETVKGRFDEGAVPLVGGEAGLEMVFIRAPRITRCGALVEVLARHGEEPVLVREGNCLAGTFHPELGADLRIHRVFMRMAEASSSRAPRAASPAVSARS